MPNTTPRSIIQMGNILQRPGPSRSTRLLRVLPFATFDPFLPFFVAIVGGIESQVTSNGSNDS